MMSTIHRPRSLLQWSSRRSHRQQRFGLLAYVIAGIGLVQAFNVGISFVSSPLVSNTLQSFGQHSRTYRRNVGSSRKAEAELLEPPIDEVVEQRKGGRKANRKSKSKQGDQTKSRSESKTGRMRLTNLVKKKLGRELDEGDITYTVFAPQDGKTGEGYFAKVTLNCFKGKPSHVGVFRKSKKEAIRSAVEMLLEDQAWQKTASTKKKMAEPPAKKKIPEARGQKKKTEPSTKEKIKGTPAKKKIPIANLEIGQELNGKVTGKNNGGVYVNVGAEGTSYVRVQELQDEGHPKPPRTGATLSLRVLSKNETYVWLTRRTGDLERPPAVDQLHLTATSFADLPTTEWFDAEVVDMTFTGVVLQVTNPKSGELGAGFLDPLDFADNFGKEVKLGDKVRVRKKMMRHDEKNHREFLIMSMKEGRDWETIKVGDSVTGKLRQMNGIKNTARGNFVDLGTDIDGYLAFEESMDGFPRKRLKPGSTVTARVLGKDSQQLNLTRRSGDLARPTLLDTDEQADLSPFTTRSPDEWFDGQVLAMLPPRLMKIAVQLPGTTAYTSGLLATQDASDSFLKEVFIGMTTKVRIKDVSVEPRKLYLSVREHVSNSNNALQDNNDQEVEEETTASTLDLSQTPTEALEDDATSAIEESDSMSESSETPLTGTATEALDDDDDDATSATEESAMEEAIATSDSPQPSAEAVLTPTDAAVEDATSAIEAAIEEAESESSEKPLSKAAIGEAIASPDSPQKPSTEKKSEDSGNLFDGLKDLLFR